MPEHLESAPLAYENPKFLNSPDARILRIMAEYQEPLSRFRRERIQDTVVFFGSARFRALDVAAANFELLANTGSKNPHRNNRLLWKRLSRGALLELACGWPELPSRWRPIMRTPVFSPICSLRGLSLFPVHAIGSS